MSGELSMVLGAGEAALFERRLPDEDEDEDEDGDGDGDGEEKGDEERAGGEEYEDEDDV